MFVAKVCNGAAGVCSTEHSDQMCRRLHIVGTAIASLIMLLEPSLILGVLVAAGMSGNDLLL